MVGAIEANEDELCPFCIRRDVEKVEWIFCDGCKKWFHYACVGINKTDVNNLSSYHCPDCEMLLGPSITRRFSSRSKKSIDYVALNEGEPTLKNRHLHYAAVTSRKFQNDFFKEVDGYLLTKSWALETCMQEPVIIRKEHYRSLGLSIPENLTVRMVTELLGEDTPIEVMDVPTQAACSGWDLKKWLEYYETPASERDRVRNVISLEFSNTVLGDRVVRPELVRQMDLVDMVWPAELKKKGDVPKVSLYCLMSVQDSYTDFHIDFGGSSVFYNVCRGSKTFLFIPPTADNLHKYEQWCLSSNQNSVFLGDLVEKCYKVDLQQGDSLIIPSCWIHAVYTPVDSLVIGGNFLTSANLAAEIKLVELEKRTRVPQKYRFPHFTRVMWYTAIHYLSKDAFCNLSRRELEGLKNLLGFLRENVNRAEDKNNPKLSKLATSSIPKRLKKDPNSFLVQLDAFIKTLEKPDEPLKLPEKLKYSDIDEKNDEPLKVLPEKREYSDIGKENNCLKSKIKLE